MWYQVYCKAPDNNGYTNPEAAKRIDDHLTSQTSSAMLAPNGIPVKNELGEYEVRVFEGSQLGYVKYILEKHYGLEITREVDNE